MSVADAAMDLSRPWFNYTLATVDSCVSKEGVTMRIEITIGPITILKVVMFEVMEDLVVLELDNESGPNGEDLNKRLRGDDD